MTQTPEYTLRTPLPDVFSSALVELFEKARSAIVQVYVEGRGGGTGVIIFNDGRIITNNHVVPRDNARVKVLLTDGRKLDAQVLERNPQLDLALLKVQADNLQALTMGDSSQLRVGEWVFAVGHPWGQRWVVTAGIMSMMSTIQLRNGATTQYIKSDVQLAPGNSGGPLLDADGNIVGINAMIFGGDLSVSIPSAVVSKWLASLPQRKVSLGVEVQQVELPAQLQESLQQKKGLLIVGLSARNPQYNDLLVGDIIFNVAGQSVSDTATLRSLLTQSSGSQTIATKVVRGGNPITLDAATQLS